MKSLIYVIHRTITKSYRKKMLLKEGDYICEFTAVRIFKRDS